MIHYYLDYSAYLAVLTLSGNHWAMVKSNYCPSDVLVYDIYNQQLLMEEVVNEK